MQHSGGVDALMWLKLGTYCTMRERPRDRQRILRILYLGSPPRLRPFLRGIAVLHVVTPVHCKSNA